jgi:hypothetical protein
MSIWGVEIPEQLKIRVSKELKKRGNTKRITQQVKEKLTETIGFIKSEPVGGSTSDANTSIVHIGLSKVDRDEKLALQAVYQYLKKLGLLYTLDTLVQETTVLHDGSGIDLDRLYGVEEPYQQPPEPEDSTPENPDSEEPIPEEEEEETEP